MQITIEVLFSVSHSGWLLIITSGSRHRVYREVIVVLDAKPTARQIRKEVKTFKMPAFNMSKPI